LKVKLVRRENISKVQIEQEKIRILRSI
jgi:hypothetical protein